MAGDKILVLGGTGPAGIVLLRELLFRGQPTVAYVRNPDKIPADLASNKLLEIIPGQPDDLGPLESAVSQSRMIISLLGPQLNDAPNPSPLPGFYSDVLFPLMKKHSVKRIIATCTVSVVDKDDSFLFGRWLLAREIQFFFRGSWDFDQRVAGVFDQLDLSIGDGGKGKENEIEWTLVRLCGIPGGASEEEWKADREAGKGVYVGPVVSGKDKWSMALKRGRLA
ncbi:NAD(P)-binding protein, partial [Rhypophila sp. PSN 637]